MSRWFRVYDDLVDDPKVQRLSAENFRALVNLWCLTSRNGGKLPSPADMAFSLRVKPEKLKNILADLRLAGLIVDDETGTHPHNWSGRQFKSDVSNERVKRHRERKCNVTSAVTVTPPDTESETEQSSVAKATGADAPPLDPVERCWKEGVPLLTAMSISDREARSNIGRWLRDTNGDAARVLGAIYRARDHGTKDPIPLIGRTLKPVGKPNGQNRSTVAVGRRLVEEFRAEEAAAMGTLLALPNR